MNNKNKSISDLIIEFFMAHPNEEMFHGPVVDWVEEQYQKLYNKKPMLKTVKHFVQYVILGRKIITKLKAGKECL